jgi:quercetin dioxygenase-like cupin family protein
MMRLHIICGALLLAHGALAQQKSAPAQQGGEKTVKLKVPPMPPSTEEYLVAQLADAKWTPANKLEAKVPAGADVALIGADPVSTGPTTYLRTKPGYKMPLHWHVHHEYATMIAGKGSFTVDGKKIPASPGTFVIIASKMHHDFTCDAGAECVFVVRRSGPTDFNLVGK